MAVTDNDKVVTIPDGLEEGAVLCFDITDNKFIDSGIKAKNGALFTDADGLNLGHHQVYSSGENIIFRNKSDDRSYYPAWREIDPTGATVSKMTARLYGSPLQPIVRFTDINSVVKNPNFEINVTGDEAVFQLQYVFVQAYTDVVLEILRKDNGQQIWKAITPHVEAGVQKIQLEVPFELKKGDYFFKIYLADETLSPIELRGDEHGNPAYTLYMRPWTDENLATETFVINEISGGHQAAYLDKATYDPDNDGSVALADKIKGAEAIPNNHYYGKNGSGNVGFFPISGTGDMEKSVYDTNNNGKVDMAEHADKATTLDGGPSAANNQFYGKDDKGLLGFHAITAPDTANKVYVKEFTTQTYKLGSTELDTDRVPYYVYNGTVEAVFALPHLNNMKPESIVFGVMNNSDEKLTLQLRSGDGWNGDDTIKAYEMAARTGLIIVSDLAQTTWFVVATMDAGHFNEFESHLLTIEAELKKHETSIDAHGVQLANHASRIQGADSTANSALTLAQQNAETIVTNRKNAIKGVTVEQDITHKTITLKFIADSGVVDTGVIDLSAWFTGGTNPPSSDHKIYYGYASRMPLNESDVLRSGTAKTVPTVSGLDIDIVRASQASSFIYVWLPDSVGTVKGFTFSGFLSVWNSTALTIAGSPGKLYSSPNRTSATHVNFEVTQ